MGECFVLRFVWEGEAHQCQRPQRGVVGVWQTVDGCMHGVTASDIIVNTFAETCQSKISD